MKISLSFWWVYNYKKEAKRATAADSRFWVVRPRLALSGVSELSTLLLGPYIGAEAGAASEKIYVYRTGFASDRDA